MQIVHFEHAPPDSLVNFESLQFVHVLCYLQRSLKGFEYVPYLIPFEIDNHAMDDDR